MRTYTSRKTARSVGLAIALLASTGCGDLFTVENPGLIADEVLNDATIVPALVTGISGDFSEAMDAVTQVIAEMTFELTAAGPTLDPYTIGVLEPNTVNSWWNAMQKARWVAEAGSLRMEELIDDYDTNVLAARANMFAGFANRLLGENVCHAVIDGGGAEPRELHFERGEEYFTRAAQIAQAAGAGAQDIYWASIAGRASVRAWQGNWSGAVADASLVPPDFDYKALFATTTSRENNGFYGDSFLAYYISVYGTPWADAQDPRTPWEVLRDAQGGVIQSRDGRVPMWAQIKYPELGSDIPITSGVEMLVLRAEAALRAGDIPGATSLMNANRAQHGMDPLPEPANEAEAWATLIFERGATLWLEARRFWDLSRWYEEGRDDSMEGRHRCMPIGRDEIFSNPNLTEFR